MILELIINESIRQEYMGWIQDVGISCSWNYYYLRDVNYLVLTLEEEDALAFKLRFRI